MLRYCVTACCWKLALRCSRGHPGRDAAVRTRLPALGRTHEQREPSLFGIDGSIAPAHALTKVSSAIRLTCEGSGSRRRILMPDRRAIEKARRDRRAGKSPTTQAGEFVREEIDKIRKGRHGARSTKQAIAIGLSEARRAGVPLRPPGKGKAKARTRKSAEYAYEAGQHKRKTRRRPRVSRAVSRVLKHEPKSTVSRAALSRQARSAASRRTASQRSAAAQKAARTKGSAGRAAAARKAARTRARRRA